MLKLSKNRIPTYLEEIVFEKIPHGFPGINCPKSVEIHVQYKKPQGKDEGRELCLIANCHQNHQNGANYILQNLHW